MKDGEIDPETEILLKKIAKHFKKILVPENSFIFILYDYKTNVASYVSPLDNKMIRGILKDLFQKIAS